MSIDPRIALGFQPTQGIGPDFGNALRNAGQMLQLRQAGQEIQNQNALKSILSQPGAIDASGNPTDDAMQKVMGVDPQMGMKLRQNALAQQENQLRLSTIRTKAFGDKLDLMNDGYGAVDKVYKDAITAGKPIEIAQQEAQQELDRVNGGFAQGGMFSETEQRAHPTRFDPIQFQKFFDGSSQIQTMLKGQSTMEKQKRDEVREEKSQEETERYHRATENQTGWQVMTDPSNKDGQGNDTPFRYNARTHEATTLTGEPYKPGGISKLASGGPQGDEPLTDDAIKYAATVYREKGTLPAFGMSKYGASDRRKIINAASQAAGEGGAEGDIVSQGVLKADQSALTQLTKSRAAIASFENTALKNGEVLVGLAEKVDTTGLPVFERWLRAGRRSIEGDPDVAQFDAQIQLYGNEVAKILTNPNLTGQLTDAARKEVQGFLPSSATYEQVKAVTELLKGDFGRRREAIDDEIKSLKEEIRYPNGRPPDREEAKKDGDAKGGGDKEGGQKGGNLGNPGYNGQKAPEKYPDAKRGDDGYWYVQKGDQFYRVDNPAADGGKTAQPAQQQPAATPAATPAGRPGASQQSPISVTDPAVAAKLPPGTWFLAPDGKVRQRPLSAAPAAGLAPSA